MSVALATVWQATWANRPAIRYGYMEASNAPGSGIELEWKMVERYRIA